jgi:hypothetical protein
MWMCYRLDDVTDAYDHALHARSPWARYPVWNQHALSIYGSTFYKTVNSEYALFPLILGVCILRLAGRPNMHTYRLVSKSRILQQQNLKIYSKNSFWFSFFADVCSRLDLFVLPLVSADAGTGKHENACKMINFQNEIIYICTCTCITCIIIIFHNLYQNLLLACIYSQIFEIYFNHKILFYIDSNVS